MLIRGNKASAVRHLFLGFSGAAALLLSSCDTTTQTSFQDAQENEPVEVSGKVVRLIEESSDESASMEKVFVQTQDGQTIPITTDEASDLESSQRSLSQTNSSATVSGIKQNNAIVLRSASPNFQSVDVTNNAAYNGPVSGTVKVLVVLLNFTNNQDTGLSASTAYNAAFVNSDSLNASYFEQSFGKVNVTGDVVGYYTTDPTTTACNYVAWDADVYPRLQSDGKNPDSYDHIVYLYRGNSSCGNMTGVAYIGGGKPYNKVWINGYDGDIGVFPRLMGHEIGHNFGFSHAHLQSCVDSNNLKVAYSTSCTVSDTGDRFDSMAYDDESPGILKHFNGPEKVKLGWISDSQMVTLDGTTSGTYTLSPIEYGNGRTYVVRVPRSDGQYYYMNFRQPSTLENIPSGDAVGVEIHIAPSIDNLGSGTILVNNNPYAANGTWGTTLNVGQTFTDPDNHFTVQTLSVSSTAAQIQVTTVGVASNVQLGSNANLCWQVRNSSTTAGAAIELDACVPSLPSQQFSFLADTGFIKVYEGTPYELCVTSNSRNPLTTGVCGTNTNFQQFIQAPNYTIQFSTAAGAYVDGGNLATGTQLYLNGYSGQASQKWVLGTLSSISGSTTAPNPGAPGTPGSLTITRVR